MSASSGRKEEAGTSKPTGTVDVFLDEYSRDDVIAKYLNGTAGTGIAYALTHVYGRVYLDVIRELIAERPRQHKFRVLEYGCGGGMNLLKLIELCPRSPRVRIPAASLNGRWRTLDSCTVVGTFAEPGVSRRRRCRSREGLLPSAGRRVPWPSQ